MYLYYIKKLGFSCWLILTYFGLVSPLLKYAIPIEVSMIIVPLAMIIMGIIAFFKINRKKTSLDYAILLIALEFFITAFASYIIFGQPLIRGFLAARMFLLILFVYYLATKPSSMAYLFRLKINLSKYVIPISIIALYTLNIDNNTISSFFHASSDEVSGGNELKGAILSYASSGIPVMFIYYLIQYVKNANRKALYMVILTVAYYIFCAKGRLLLVGCIFVLFIFCIQNRNKRSNNLLYYTIIGFLCICLYDIHIFDSFMALADFFGTNGKIEDSSVLVRVANRDYLWPVIISHPIFGVGNLSNQFHPNFFDLFHEKFYVADMGYLGILLTGGFFKVFVYTFFFIAAFRRCKSIGPQADIIKYLLYYYLYFCVACQDVFLFDYAVPLLIAPLLNMKCLYDKKYPFI